MRRIFSFLALVLIISGCSDKSKFTITGVIKNPAAKYVHLSRLDVDNPVLLDSAKISSKGSFQFKVKASQADFYQVGISGSNYITLLAEPGEKIKLAFDSGNLYDKYSISGSEGSSRLQQLDITLAETKSKLDSLSNAYSKALNEPGAEAKTSQIEAEINAVIKAQRKKSIEFIINNINSLASIKALYQRLNPETYVLYDPHDLQYLKIVTDSLTKHYPDSKQVKALAADFKKEKNQMYASQIQQLAQSMPITKLDPDLRNTEGKRIALSSLKGKYVLLTFWSVTSKECIAENLELKELYKLYNKKGLEIYQINLDQKESDWLNSVRFDELPWINTREDDPKNPKNAILYNVRSLPANFLYNKENVIIATDLHGRNLRLKLNQLFNS